MKYETKQIFKGDMADMATLGTKEEKKGDSFLIFQKELYVHVLANYKFPSDIAYLVKDLKDPISRLKKLIPSMRKLRNEWGIHNADEDITDEEKVLLADLKELLAPERKAFIDRKSILIQKFSKLYGLMWGQCTP